MSTAAGIRFYGCIQSNFEEILVKSEGIIRGNTNDSAEKLDAMIDLNLGLEYHYSNVLSGFLNLNNLLGQRYYHWYNYPAYRFNLMIGVTYSF